MAQRLEEPALHEVFRALADPTRLRLLNLIAGREVCVCYFVEILGLSQPKVSRHLAYLRRAGVVAVRREGKWMHYRLATPRGRAAARVLHEVLQQLRNDPAMQHDAAMMSATRCVTSRVVIIAAKPRKRLRLPKGAPAPTAIRAR